MEAIKDYFKNIDFTLIEDPQILNNVYTEIDGYEEKLATDPSTTSQFETLIKKSTTSQLILLSQKFKINHIIKKKDGSRVIETFLTTLFDNVYINKDVYPSIAENLKFVAEVELNFNDFVFNKNATHVLRKYFEFVYGCRVVVPAKKYKSILCESSEDLFFEKLVDLHKENLMGVLEKDVPLDVVITIVHYLKLKYSKKIARCLIRKLCTIENLKVPQYSYVFEDIIKIADAKTLEYIFEIIKGDFTDLATDKNSNYVINGLVKQCPSKLDFFYTEMDFSRMPANSNVVLRILEASVVQKDKTKTDNLLENFYKIDKDVFYELLLSNTETPDTKYVDLICYLMDWDDNDYGCNRSFVKHFNGHWLSKKYGIKLLKGFLEGGASDELKSKFVSTCKDFFRLKDKKEGKEIMQLVRVFKRNSNRKENCD